MSGLIIRKAKKEEFDEIYKLLKQLWPDKRLTKNKIEEIFLKRLKDKKAELFVLKKENNVIGYGSLVYHDDFMHGKTGFIGELVIEEKQRNKGYGSELLKNLIKKAKENYCKYIDLNSAVYRRKAHRFYKKQGFKKEAYYFIKKI